ncbi:hypothetical protein ACE6H2_023018 [Prunus campanulata]
MGFFGHPTSFTSPKSGLCNLRKLCYFPILILAVIPGFLGAFKRSLRRLSRGVTGSWNKKGSRMNKTTESKRPRQLERQKGKKKGCNTRTSQEVTHPSTTLAQTRLTSEF